MTERVTIKKLAEQIQAEWPELYVRVERHTASTDRKLAGTRLIRPGKGRTGTRIIVMDPKHPEYPRSASVLLDHANSETYRRTADVVEWMERMREKRVIPCAVCRKPKHEEKDRQNEPGRYVRRRRRGWCRCKS